MRDQMTRRSFLKCAGAATVAVGAATLLGGCNPIDGIVNNATKDVPEAVTKDGVLFVVSGVTAAKDDNGKEIAYLPGLSMVNLNLGTKSVSTKNFSLTVDGKKTNIRYGDAAKKLSEKALENWPEKDDVLLLDKNGSCKVPTGTSGDARYGLLVFEPAEAAKGEWKTAELTISFGGSSTTFIIPRDGDIKRK